MKKQRYGFDIETNGLMPSVNKIWCLVLVDPDSDEVFKYSDYDPSLPSLVEGLTKLYEADIIFGHNVIGYDLVVLKYLIDWVPNPKTKVIDTWIMSQVNRYKRTHRHSLEGWGQHLKCPKGDYNDWTQYTPEMLTYCIQDVRLNVLVYMALVREAVSIQKINPLYFKGLDVEMEFAQIEADIQRKGWYFDREGAIQLYEEIDTEMRRIEAMLEPRIGMRCIKTDKADEFKEPAWRKDGFYTVATVKHFGYTQESGREERPIEGPYCRVSFEQGKVSTDAVLKDYLYSIGWVPDEWNVERINGKFVNKSPKLTESSLDLLGEEGKDISMYNSLKNRRGILSGWIEASEYDGRLHGRMWTIGTPTFRCRHEVIANLPSVDAVYGKQMRGLFKAEPGYMIVGADSAGNQMRGLCHYINNADFTNEVINGDVHQKNADILSTIYPCSRKTAKPWLYAYLFGAGAGKSGLILTGKRDATIGKQSQEKFESSIPGLKELKDSLNDQYKATSNAFGEENGFIRGIDGRIIFVGSAHQLLNYLLQTAEGVTCKAAIVYLKQKLKEKGIVDYYFALHYHDELAVVCREEDADLIAELSVEAFTEAPKWFGIQCMNGAAHTGYNYAEVH
jgi:DNA polymerase-1